MTFRHLLGTTHGGFSIGAPRFELGTSCPPDCSGEWRSVRRIVGKWLGRAVSLSTTVESPLSSMASARSVWARIGHRTILATALALVLAAGASAAVPPHPSQHYSTFSSRLVCAEQTVFHTAPTPAHKLIHLNVTVDGKRTIGYPINANTWESAGHGVIVRVIQQKHTAPLTIRAASVRFDCARVNVLATWR